MKVAIVCIVKNENRYLREFIKYYINLGFDTIFIGDNNDSEGEWVAPILDDYIEQNKVFISNLRSIKSNIENNFSINIAYYNYVYKKIKYEYDWIAFVDCDEFITLKGFNNNIHEYLNQEVFDNFNVINLNWECYNDNNIIYDDGKNVIDRFIHPFDITHNPNNILNRHIKSIVRGNIEYNNIYISNSHYPIFDNVKYCNNEGLVVDKEHVMLNTPASYKYAYIRHYFSKSLEEYVNYKIHRGAPDVWGLERNLYTNISEYFNKNNVTENKLKYLMSRNIQYNPNYKELKTVIVCIVKKENQYLREFVEYYKNLGFTNIILYDNNDIDGELLYPVISDYINSGFVKIYNVRGVQQYHLQLSVYNEAYKNYYNKYDWFAFIDCDEYIILNKHKTISEYLSQEKFNKCNKIVLFWKVYGDNNMIYNDGRRLIDRFINESKTSDVKTFHNKFNKNLIKGGLKEYTYNNLFNNDSAHDIYIDNACDCNGNTYFTLSCPTNDPIYGDAHINHYMTKTISEFINQKYLGINARTGKSRCNFGYYFSINEITQEKIDYIKSKGIEINEDIIKNMVQNLYTRNN